MVMSKRARHTNIGVAPDIREAIREECARLAGPGAGEVSVRDYLLISLGASRGLTPEEAGRIKEAMKAERVSWGSAEQDAAAK